MVLGNIFQISFEMDIVENSKLLSYVLRYVIMTLTRNKKKVFLIDTDTFINFLPQLNDKFVADKSIVYVRNPNSYALAKSKLQCVTKPIQLMGMKCVDVGDALQGSTLQRSHLDWDDIEKSPQCVIFLSSSSVSIDDMKVWKSRKVQQVALFVAVEDAEKSVRLCHEVGARIQINSTLDYYYHENRKMSAFIKLRLKHSLDSESFGFLSTFQYILVEL